jgi:hypothetical protein
MRYESYGENKDTLGLCSVLLDPSYQKINRDEQDLQRQQKKIVHGCKGLLGMSLFSIVRTM